MKMGFQHLKGCKNYSLPTFLSLFYLSNRVILLLRCLLLCFLTDVFGDPHAEHPWITAEGRC